MSGKPFSARTIAPKAWRPGRIVPAWLAAVGVLLAAACMLTAQAPPQPAGSPQTPAAHKPRVHAKHAARRKPSPNLSARVKAVGPEPAPPVPPTPHWPANEPPNSATITWNSRGLEINASNSSLQQILSQVGTMTGTKIEGLGPDERIFGTYGPGPARDVLTQLLHGTEYNVLMLGDEGAGTPREVILSARSNVPAARPGQQMPPQPQDDEEEGNGEEQPPPGPVFNRPPLSMPPQRPPVTPQQRLQQMQEMEQERQRQQQQQGPQ